MHIWGKGRAAGRVGSGRVRLFVSNRGSGRVGSTFCRVGSKKSDPWTTLYYLYYYCTTRGCGRDLLERIEYADEYRSGYHKLKGESRSHKQLLIIAHLVLTTDDPGRLLTSCRLISEPN